MNQHFVMKKKHSKSNIRELLPPVVAAEASVAAAWRGSHPGPSQPRLPVGRTWSSEPGQVPAGRKAEVASSWVRAEAAGSWPQERSC